MDEYNGETAEQHVAGLRWLIARRQLDGIAPMIGRREDPRWIFWTERFYQATDALDAAFAEEVA